MDKFFLDEIRNPKIDKLFCTITTDIYSFYVAIAHKDMKDYPAVFCEQYNYLGSLIRREVLIIEEFPNIMVKSDFYKYQNRLLKKMKEEN